MEREIERGIERENVERGGWGGGGGWRGGSRIDHSATSCQGLYRSPSLAHPHSSLCGSIQQADTLGGSRMSLPATPPRRWINRGERGGEERGRGEVPIQMRPDSSSGMEEKQSSTSRTHWTVQMTRCVWPLLPCPMNRARRC